MHINFWQIFSIILYQPDFFLLACIAEIRRCLSYNFIQVMPFKSVFLLSRIYQYIPEYTLKPGSF
jgi:hypothetical protein